MLQVSFVGVLVVVGLFRVFITRDQNHSRTQRGKGKNCAANQSAACAGTSVWFSLQQDVFLVAIILPLMF